MESQNYVTIQGWMRTELNLKGNELLIYAIIYGFSQTENHKFTGSLQYLADWCGTTKQSILRNINILLEQDLIEKEDNYVNGVKFVYYRAKKITTPVTKDYHPGNKRIPYNIENKKIDKKEDSISKDILGQDPENFLGSIKTNKQEMNNQRINKFLNMYRYRTELPQVKVLSDSRKKNILRILDKYTEEDIATVLDNFNTSDFLLGRASDFKANLDWMLNENNFIKILEGKYNNKNARSKYNSKSFDKAESVTYTEEELQEIDKLNKEREAHGLQTKF